MRFVPSRGDFADLINGDSFVGRWLGE